MAVGYFSRTFRVGVHNTNQLSEIHGGVFFSMVLPQISCTDHSDTRFWQAIIRWHKAFNS